MRSSLRLRVLTGVALVAVAVLHLKIAKDYVDVGDKPFSIGDQFYAQAAAALALTLALLVRPHKLVWAATFGFGAVSLAALVYSRYRGLPVVGLPGGFQETWDAPQAKRVAVAETAVIVFALIGLALPRASAGSADG